MELDKIIPTDGPNINEVEKYINKYQSEVIVIKCGGSVLLDKKLFNHTITYRYGLMEDRCSKLLKEFFKLRR